jgi:hypothetical protein
MRNITHWIMIALTFTALTILIGCNDGILSNPVSPPAATTEWRTLSVGDTGGSFDFSDIGAIVTVPAGAIPMDEIWDLSIRLFPGGIPLLPSGPVLVRLGTFELIGPDGAAFLKPVEVRFRIAKAQDPGVGTKAYALDDTNAWYFVQNATVLNDGAHVAMTVLSPGIYGSFQVVPLHIEASVSNQQGNAPLGVSFYAVVTGGHPPYDIAWDFGDNSDKKAGTAVSHWYKDPSDYNPSVMVIDADDNFASDTLLIQAY